MVDGEVCFRWDALFLVPVTPIAREAARAIIDWTSATNAKLGYALADHGDTLLVDNWTTLHGRSSVGADSAGRHIERVYLSEIRE
jgi:hypothetical protein